MGLSPLEFTDCLTDSPKFRENLHAHEDELQRTSQAIKLLVKEGNHLVTAARTLSKAQRNFSTNLINFKFECIGFTQTDDEKYIADSLKEFGRLIAVIEDERERMLDRAYDQFIRPLKSFRSDHIGATKEGKKKFDKLTAKYCQSVEKHVNLSTKKNDNILQEADVLIEMEQRAFQQASLQYVFSIQEVQERKKFEFVETILGFMYGWLTFYHQGYEVAKDFKPFMTELQIRLQRTRQNFNSTRDEAETLMHKMLEVRKTKPQDSGALNKHYARQGYLFLMEKKAFVTTWTKQYCMYRKENKEFTMIPYTQATGKMTSSESMILKSCVRRSSDSIEKRFCFDITTDDKPPYTLQAMSEEDRRLWLDVMDGKEPTYSQPGKLAKAEETFLDDIGFNFVKKCIGVLETRGLEDQGLYRLVGVSSKVSKLIQMGLDRRKIESLSLEDAMEWENKTITSALKTYFRNLPEPLLTFRFHNDFISAAKKGTWMDRINAIHVLVQDLPKLNSEMLEILIRHLCSVAAKCDKNLMTVSNLGVCFGPTLLRPEEETMAAIMDIKFCNIVVEILIENCEKIFKSAPFSTDKTFSIDKTVTQPLPTRPAKPPSFAHLHTVRQNHNHHHEQETHLPSNGKSVQQVTHMAATTFNPEVPTCMSVNTVGIPSPNLGNSQMLTPPSLRYHTAHAKPLIIYNPVGPESNQLGSNSNSSSESISSHSSRDASHHSSSNSPQAGKHMDLVGGYLPPPASEVDGTAVKTNNYNSGGKLAPHPWKEARPRVLETNAELPIKKRPSVDSLLSSTRVRTLYSCVGENESELSFEPNQIITNVRPSREPGWLEGTLNGKIGLIPENYVQYLP